MRRPLAGLMIAMMTLSACAGAGPDRPSREATASYHDEADDEHARHASAVRHYHDDPVPYDHDLYQAGQIAMLLSAQVFACAFFVVILDGACDFHVSAGYY